MLAYFQYHIYTSLDLIAALIKGQALKVMLMHRASLVIFSTEGETSSNPGVSETQPPGDFCGDSKDCLLINAISHLKRNQKMEPDKVDGSYIQSFSSV